MNKTRFGLSANAYAALTFLAGIINPIITLVMAGAVLLTEDNDWLKRMVLKALAFVILTDVAVAILGEVSLDGGMGGIGNLMSMAMQSEGMSISLISSKGGLISSAIDAINGLLSYVKSGFNAEMVKGFFGLCGTIVVVLKAIFLILFAKKAFAGQYVKLPVGDGIVEKNVQ